MLKGNAYLLMKMVQNVPKCQRIEFRSRGITQKKAYSNVKHLSEKFPCVRIIE